MRPGSFGGNHIRYDIDFDIKYVFFINSSSTAVNDKKNVCYILLETLFQFQHFIR